MAVFIQLPRLRNPAHRSSDCQPGLHAQHIVLLMDVSALCMTKLLEIRIMVLGNSSNFGVPSGGQLGNTDRKAK